jgi:hypothetical protein
VVTVCAEAVAPIRPRRTAPDSAALRLIDIDGPRDGNAARKAPQTGRG